MTTFKLDPLLTPSQNLDNLLGTEDLLYKFEVVPFDYTVSNSSSPTLFLTESRLIFFYDDIFEVYQLDQIEIEALGGRVGFTVWQQYAEGTFYYGEGFEDDLVKMKNLDSIVRLSIREEAQINKEFLLRDGANVRKNFQTWAVVQLILNIKKGEQKDPVLEEMVLGSFMTFDRRIVLWLLPLSMVYIILRLIVNGLDVTLVRTVLDTIFGIGLIAIFYLVVRSMNRNMERFNATYLSYFSDQNRAE